MQMRGDAAAGDGVCGYFDTWDQKRLFYRLWEAPNATKVVVCLHGAFGHGEFFSLVADRLVPRGITTAVFDYRGHGRSEGKRGDVKKFAQWYQDADTFIQFLQTEVNRTGLGEFPFFVLGESMGGGLAAGISTQFPDLPVQGFVLFSPAVKFRFGSFSLKDALKVIPWGIAHIFAPGKAVAQMTGHEDTGIADPLHQEYDRTDSLHLQKASPRYLLELNKAVHRAFETGPAATTRPTIIFAGVDDPAIDAKGVQDYFDRLDAGGDKKLVLIEGSKHTLFDDPAFQPHWQEFFDWLDAH
ncbi:MAG TPA: alpha/beta fold hydrolase [Candidatus Lokiarchaeia archaeon]|nr:alpha/beta fold hydrolase [Candidatus Lokiarchaeia archaeon]